MLTKKYIILFDGECNFCSFWVRYVIKKDRKDLFRFATLQSEIGHLYHNKYNIDYSLDTVVLIEDDRAYIKSTAALRILKLLGGLKTLFYGFIIVPAFVRNGIYNVVAKYRYYWFGKSECELISNQNMKNKFLM